MASTSKAAMVCPTFENNPEEFTVLYVKNLSETTTMEDLHNIFGAHGEIKTCVICKDENGNSKGSGFIEFVTHQSAVSAVGQSFNIDGKNWVAERALSREEIINKYGNRANLYVKNFEADIDDEKLKGMFSKFGAITSSKVMLDQNGVSRGFGFVAFSTPEEAEKAIQEMNGKIQGRKQLYVSVAEPKEERQAKLKAYYARPVLPTTSHVVAPRPNCYYGPRMIPGQMGPRFGFPSPQFLPRPGMVPVQRVGPRPDMKLASARQREILWRELYPLVQYLVPIHLVGKVTRMLLEMDGAEVLYLIESHDALRAKVGEVLQVLASA